MENLKQSKEFINELMDLMILKCRVEKDKFGVSMLISLHCDEKTVDISIDYSNGPKEGWES